MLQLCRWLPGRSIIFIGDSSFAVHELAHAVSGRATLISRLRLDANLFAPPPHRQAHSVGRPAQKGAPAAQAEDPARLDQTTALASRYRLLLVRPPRPARRST